MSRSKHLSDQVLPALASLREAPRWLVAFSGGLDSTVLLHLLVSLRAANPDFPPLQALHIHHGLQSEADRWQRRCEQFCQTLAVPFICEQVRVTVEGKGLEAAARDARYAAFESHLGAGEVLFVAQHKDDQVETFMLRLLRGAGVEGLAAMPPSRPLGQGQLFRPLLDVTREQLAHYAKEHGLPSIDDPSNADTTLDRNFLRHEVLPLLDSRWPAYRDTVARAAAHLRDAADQLRRALPEVPRCYSRCGDPGLALAPLLDLPDSEAAQVLRDWLQQLGHTQAPASAPLLEFLRQLRAGDSSSQAQLQSAGICLQRFQQGLYCLPAALDEALPESQQLELGESYTDPALGTLSLVQAEGPGLALQAGEALSLRWRSGGERCRLPGRAGTRSLKKLLQEAKVPPWWRNRVPLLYLGDELLAVGDLWLCDSSRLQAIGPSWQVRWKRNTPTP
ncbi:tRNA lysidine(34) synthetase TilS [Parahaliea sp. F7430]|uniref:tRNA(Ile)-lysidine synthase n=1 Tax=Sediminihaliea albiluteola TaxID=2758564 RepID=A0A7W2TTZ9_9GAMM|nr:tRNA lysidine(34) synthetase TilS [Sediminihaliea albiluteola]MBA6411881.1 tRNA lysidine(34) synthetase TilS [Sediminihaliea albiluteola]